MVLFKAIGEAIGGLAKPFLNFFSHKRELKHIIKRGELEAATASAKAMVAIAAQGQANTHEWEMAQIKNSGWKDEFVLLVIYFPVVSLFLRYWSDPIKAVQALSEFPDWYTYTLLAVTLAVYGVRLSMGAYRGLMKK